MSVMRKLAEQLKQFEGLNKLQQRKLDKMQKRNVELKQRALLKSKGDDVGKTINFSNSINYSKNADQFLSRSIGNEEDRNVDESFKSEIWKEIEIRFNALKKRFTENEVSKAVEQNSSSSFTPRILQCPQPQRLTIPMFKLFNEKADPEDHIYRSL